MTNSSEVIGGGAPGLIVLGTEPGCGKTVLMCGIAAALREQGFNTCVFKPIFLSSRKKADAELSFLASVGYSSKTCPISFIDGPQMINESNWNNAVLACRNGNEQLNLIEMPGGTATPVCYEQTNAGTLSHQWRDTVEMAAEIQRPCLLVAKHQTDAIEQLVVNFHYAQARGLKVIALATVETAADQGAELERKRTRGDFGLGLVMRTNIPFLGCIKFSPSISVPRVNQGNLVKMTAGLDLLLLLKTLNVGVPASEH